MLSLKSARDFAKVAAVCAVFVAGWEGLWLTVKPDRLAYGIPTGGYGETENVKLGETHTEEYWRALLAQKLPRYWGEIAQCIKVAISDNEMIAYTSFAYNVGSAGFCRSSLLRKLNAGDHKGACDGLLAWNRAGGKEVRGLNNRRAAERKLCLTPDKKAPLADKRPTEDSAGAIKSLPGPKVAPAPPPLSEAPTASAPKRPVCRGFWLWKRCTS